MEERQGARSGTSSCPVGLPTPGRAPPRRTDCRGGYALGVTDPDRVYFSRVRDFARSFAARQITADRESGIIFQHGSLYRVEPIGAVELDPDFALHASHGAHRQHVSPPWRRPK